MTRRSAERSAQRAPSAWVGHGAEPHLAPSIKLVVCGAASLVRAPTHSPLTDMPPPPGNLKRKLTEADGSAIVAARLRKDMSALFALPTVPWASTL